MSLFHFESVKQTLNSICLTTYLLDERLVYLIYFMALVSGPDFVSVIHNSSLLYIRLFKHSSFHKKLYALEICKDIHFIFVMNFQKNGITTLYLDVSMN